MKRYNLLPLTMAVAAALSTSAVFADDDAFVNKQIDDQQPLVIDTETKIPEGIVFSGYARYGLHFSQDDNKYVQASGALSGRDVGRLGNESNGGEFQFAKAFKGANGTIWDVVVMMENWWKYKTELESGEEISEYGDVALKKFYAGATNVFASQPDAYLWAGRDFHQRPQQGLNDYFWMSHDGQGAGVYNLDFGGAKFNISAVAKADGTGDSDNYAITSKLHGIQLTDGLALSFLANYGFSDDKDETINPYQVAMVLDHSYSSGRNQFIARYSDSTTNSVFDRTDDMSSLYLSLEGGYTLSDRTTVDYLVGYNSYDSDDSDARVNYNAIVRPMHSWNDTHSTWIEAGYSVVDYDDGDDNSAWKVTFSQNIAIGGNTWDRPMLRFYATTGEADNKHDDSKQDTFAVGAMWEAWW